MKKKVYMAQPTNMLANSIYLPYTVGTIAAYAWQFADICDHYKLKDFIFFKHPVDEVVAGLDAPFLVAFSNYMWNVDYNLELARAVKNEWPDVWIVFGGVQIPENTQYLEQYSFIDFLIFGEGERPFADLLKCLLYQTPPEEVCNIAFRKDSRCIMSKKSIPLDLEGYPSPYLKGFFDDILKDERYAGIQFDAVLETNRGCPYKCIYCSWGDSKAPLRKFSMEKVKGELLWFAEHKISFIVCADGNFGIFPRDEEIADEIISLKKKYGFPQKFSSSSAKNKDDLTFRINKKLDEMDLNKGVSVAVQSLAPEVLHIIGRINMSLDSFASQLKRYREAGVITFTDLILGLPGDTYNSFCESLFSVIEAGQHYFINVSRCELLPNAPMNKPDVIEQYGIKTIRSVLYQNHSNIGSDRYGSRSEIVVETNTMSVSDWKKMLQISLLVQAFHYFGMLRYVAICFRQAFGVSYQNFYCRVYEYCTNENAYLRSLLEHVTGCVDSFLQKKGDLVFVDQRFGNIYIPFEEGLFLCAAADHARFFAEIKPCLTAFCEDRKLFEDLFQYQRNILNLPASVTHEYSFAYDWKSYFEDIHMPTPRMPKKEKNVLRFVPDSYSDLIDYTREIVWYGKRSGKTMISNVERLS